MKRFIFTLLALLSADAQATNFFDHVNSGIFSVIKRDESSSATLNALDTSKTYVKLTSTVTTINGAVAPTSPISKMLIISNQTGGTVTIAHASGSATAANRFALQGAVNLPVLNGGTASFLYDHGQSRWIQFGGGGVTSVGLVDGSINGDFNITGSPVTGSGNISIAFGAQGARKFLASASVSSVPSFRAIQGPDLPNPSSSSLGGTQSKTCASGTWFNEISTSGVPACTQPAFSDLSGHASPAQKAQTNVALTTCSTARTVDWSTGDSFTLTLTNGSACTLTFSNMSAAQTITLWLKQASSGGGTATVVWPTAKWFPAGAPTMTVGNSALDVCTCTTSDGTDVACNCLQGGG